MPFVIRQIKPIYIARQQPTSSSAQYKHDGSAPLKDNELERITNLTLSNAMRQLSSLLTLSKEIFTELNKELELVGERSGRIKQKLNVLQAKVDDPSYDSKLVIVPESDLVTFVQIKSHYKTDYEIGTKLFTVETRSATLAEMYDMAAKTPVPAINEIDRLMGHRDRRSSDAFICTPIMGQTRRRMNKNIDIDIETRMPAAIEDLRKWTSNEAIGDITVAPDCIARVSQNNSTNEQHDVSMRPSTSHDCTDNIISTIHNTNNSRSDDDKDLPLDHRLPSPEEQCQILALKYPAQIVRVDTSGKRFDRMSVARKSLLHVQSGMQEVVEINDENTVKRRSRSRKPRGKRRNTIAGIDQKEIEGITENGELELENGSPSTSRDAEITFVPRSKSSDVLKKESAFCNHDVKRASSHFNSLKQWGKNRLRAINRLSSNSDDTSKSFKYKANSSDIDDFNVLEAINRKQKKLNEKDRKLSQERKPSYSSSERSLNLNSSISGVSGNAVSTITIPSALPVKLREPSSLRRHRRTGLGNKDEPHSSSGNWSASSESGRTSIGSEITTTTTHPKSSASSTSLNHHLNHATTSSSGPPSSIISRRRFLNTSASSSMSEGTATPDLQMFDHDEGENSSIYSCDTEGYYTSFHVDSGLKTLKEEDSMTPVHSILALSSTNSFESSGNQTVLSPENEYELFGKGSTTTSSSAGTVCTAVLSHECERNGPIVPERKSSLTKLNRSGSSNSSGNLERTYSTSTVGSTLEKGGTIKRNGVLLQKEVVAIVHQDKIIKRIESPDSGNNTSSSPVDSNSSPTNHNVRAYSEFECSESSDLECVERTERIRVKTTINTSRIPSMCVITPTPSDDDEGNSNFKSSKNEEIKIKGNLLNLNMETGYATVMPQEIKKEIPRKASPLLPLNTMLGKLRGVLQPLKKSPHKEVLSPIYDTVGDYVTIADVRTPIKKASSNGVYYSNEVLKRNLATVLSGNLTDETEYVSLNELPCNMRSESNLLAIQENEKVDNLNESIGGESGNKNKGALVKLDAQGKVIYSSDSLKRKKGAYTTFSPGPCVKEEQSSTTTTPTSPIVVELEQKKSISSPFLSGSGVKNRKAGNIRPVVVQRPVKSDDISVPNNPIDLNQLQQIATTSSESQLNPIKSETQMSTNNNNNNRIPLNTNLTGYNTSIPIRGAYVNIQDAAPLRNGPPVYSPPSPTRAAAILLQQQEDYQRLYRDNEMSTSVSSNRWDTNDNALNAGGSHFQRGNDVYWTLQSRTKHNPHRYLIDENVRSRDDVVDGNRKNIEDLYSTPNKTNNLKTTPLGFEFFSPVAQKFYNEKIVEEKVTCDPDINVVMSPIDPRNKGVFSTSTPQKNPNFSVMSPSKTSMTEELRSRLKLQHPGIRSHGNSPLNSGRSTPKGIFEPHSSRSRHSWSSNNVEVPQTCLDRLGTPKTSLMDFKKLLLNKNTSKPGKISAVQQLQLSKSNVQSPPLATNTSNINILDLSGSPKTFATRRQIRQGQFGNSLSNSPTKSMTSGKQIGGKHGWRLNNMRTDVISTAIPELPNENSREEEESLNANKEKKVNLKSPEIIIRDENVSEVSAVGDAVKVLKIKENIFMKQQENNFTKTEIQEHKKHNFQQQQQQQPAPPPHQQYQQHQHQQQHNQIQLNRAQFLFGASSATSNNNKTAVFTSGGHYSGIVTTKDSTIINNNTPSLETAL